MSEIDQHLSNALTIVESAIVAINNSTGESSTNQVENNPTHNQDVNNTAMPQNEDNGGGGIGGWLKDKAQSGFDAAQNGWQNLPGKDFVEDPLINARDTIVNGAVDGWNSLPGNEFVEGQIGDLTDKIPFNNVVGASVRALAGQSEISIDQDGINLITADPAWQDFKSNQVNGLVNDVQNDPRFGNEAFTITLDSANLEFGGQRGSFNPFDPSSADTWEVASNELTWLLRHADIETVAQVDAHGTITINYKVDDTLDLRPGEGRSDAYNNTTAILGTIWHDILGGEEANITGEWTEVIEPDNG